MGRRCGDCDCGARGLRGLGLGGWIWGIRLQAPRGPALRVKDSVAAAATWLDIARYSDTGGISQRYTPGGGFSTRSTATGDKGARATANQHPFLCWIMCGDTDTVSLCGNEQD